MRNACFAALLAATSLTAPAALAQSAAPAAAAMEIARGPVPDWVTLVPLMDAPANPRGLIFFRRQQADVHLGPDGQRSFSSYRARLLHPNALQFGNLAITWNPAVGTPVVHTITIHRDGEAIDVLADHDFEILRREDMLEQAMITGMLTATLQVADLRVGDELEVAFTVPTANPTLPLDDSGLMMLADAPPAGRYYLGVSWQAGHEPVLRTAPAAEPLLRRTANSIALVADNPPGYAPPRDAPPRYQWTRVVEFSDFSRWQDISARFHTLFAQASQLAPSSPLRAEAARIAARHPTQLARATAALELVELQTRYIYVGLNQGGYTPASADETWSRRYGDCKGKTALLLALLAELGVEAEAVLASNTDVDDGLDQRLPSPGMFDHVLVRARIDGQTLWMDPTMPGVARPTPRPLVLYRFVLPLSAAGSDLEALPYEPHAKPQAIELWDMDASDGFAQPARISRQTVLRGLAGLSEYLSLSAVTDEQLADAFRADLAGSEQWNTIDTVTYRYDADHQASILSITGTGPLDWEDEGGGRRELVLPGGGFSPPPRAQRSADQDQAAPWAGGYEFECRVATLRLPRGSRPERWSFNEGYATHLYSHSYRRQFERRDTSIRMISVIRSERAETTAERAIADNARLADFDDSMAVVSYDPADNFRPARQSPLPAVSEVDWVADPAACAPAPLRVLTAPVRPPAIRVSVPPPAPPRPSPLPPPPPSSPPPSRSKP